MGKLTVADHPLIKHKVTLMRDERTGTKQFRELAQEVGMLLCYEITRDLTLEEIEVKSPIGTGKGYALAGKKLGVVPILRAGLGMVEGMTSLIPAARIGHIGLYRDPETLEPVEYYCKLPSDSAERDMIICDPMLATGGSASAAIGFLKQRGVRSIKLACIIGSPAGVARIQEEHPDVDIFLAAQDEVLSEHGYIIPGLGDAGDRLFGTK